MTFLGLPFDAAALQLRLLFWPLLFGAGAYLLLTAQPVGRPKPPLIERLHRLDVDARVRAELGRREVRPFFASRVLEGILRPILDDAGRFVHSWLSRFGLAGGRELERQLRLARPGVEVAQFFGEKVVAGLIAGAFFPLMNVIGVHPFGRWPLWVFLAAFIAGFLAPDRQLEQRVARRRAMAVMELPTILDMLTIAASAGLALEQALNVVARQSGGTVAQELQYASREMALGQRTLVEALEAMAQRNGLPEITRFVSQLQAAHGQGTSLVQTLSAQAEALRDQKRLHILEAGGKASVRMILPVALFILPVLFVVLLVPAAVELLHLGG